jgi:hypothetical protein
VLAVFLENLEILGGLSIFFQEGAVKSVVDFEEGKVLEVFCHVLNRHGLFVEGFTPYLVVSSRNPFLITAL